ncbi:MAG: Membrane-bound hydrogenase subunit alpha [Candidatus Thorarchaeota archaeon]|nr:MAG: Membrane-bound hydrogenase subunit alpha [Candidatus Thorarchaeota archaeon]
MTSSEKRKVITPPRVSIPIGPQHPALKEPGMFKLTVEGERIIDAEVNIGYNHRGIEKLAEQKTFTQILYLVERICGICSATHNGNFAQASEFAAEVDIPDRAKFIRTLTWELERIHSHILWLGVAFHEVGFDTAFMYTWRDREVVMDMLEDLSGNRVNYAMNTVGGVRRDVSDDLKQRHLKGLDHLEERMEYYRDTAIYEKTFWDRINGVGMLPTSVAKSTSAVGPTARGSNVPVDVRFNDPTMAYVNLRDSGEFDMILSDRCDIAGRAVVRVLETIQSIQMCRWLLNNLPDGPIRERVRPRIQPNEVLARYEAPRGECIHYLITNGTDKPDRLKIRAPTHANWVSMAHTLRGGYIADAPITLAAIDPCFSCTDRVAIVDSKDESMELVTLDTLRVRANKWYAENPRRVA